MTADVTGTDILRSTARNRAREGGLARLARDYSISLAALDDFTYHGGRLPAKALQDLTKDFFGGFAEFDSELDRLRPINRAEPTVFATAMPPQFERRPLSDVVPPRPVPKTTAQPQPARVRRAGWAE
jgi:hypothetical protein